MSAATLAACLGVADLRPAHSAERRNEASLSDKIARLEAETRLLKNRIKALVARGDRAAGNVVRSSTRRVRVQIYGQMSRAVVFHAAPDDGGIHHVDNDGSPSRIGVQARTRLFERVTLSGTMEIETIDNRRSITGDATDGNFGIQLRAVEIAFTHDSLGTVWMGHGSLAAEAVGLFTLSGTSIVFAAIVFDAGVQLNSTPTGQATPANAIAPGLYYGVAATVRRGNRIMYGSPRVKGFHFRVSHSEFDVVEAAAHHFGHPLGPKSVRILAGLGYIRSPGSGATATGRLLSASNTVTGSIGILHLPTGLNIAFAGGTTRVEDAPRVMNPYYWYVEGGWQGRLWSLGRTYFSAGYAQSHGGFSAVSGAHLTAAPGNDIHAWRVNAAVLQELDAAFADIYAGWAYYDAKRTGTKLTGAHLFVIGGRIKF